MKFHTIEEAILEIQAGKCIIVVDDEDRENEGDFLTAARNASPEMINFSASNPCNSDCNGGVVSLRG